MGGEVLDVPGVSLLDDFFQTCDVFVVICLPLGFPHVEFFPDKLDVGLQLLHQRFGNFGNGFNRH